MKFNFLQKTPVPTILNAINAHLNTQLNEGNCLVLPPDRVNKLDRNSRIVIRCLPNSGIIGKYFVYYNRLHISNLLVTSVNRLNHKTMVDLLPAINSLNGANIEEIDIINVDLPINNDNESKIDFMDLLLIKPSSWFWYDGNIASSDLPMIAPLTDKTLNLFNQDQSPIIIDGQNLNILLSTDPT